MIVSCSASSGLSCPNAFVGHPEKKHGFPLKACPKDPSDGNDTFNSTLSNYGKGKM